MAAGAYLDDYKRQNAGSVLVWQRFDYTESFTNASFVKLSDQLPSDQNYLDRSIALSEDTLTLAACAYEDDDKGTNAGSVLIWQRHTLSMSFAIVRPVRVLDPGGGSSDYLGHSVALSASGFVLVASAHGDFSSAGSLVVWERTALMTSFATIMPTRLKDPAGVSGDLLGYKGVFVSSDGLFVGEKNAQNEILVWNKSSPSSSFASSIPVEYRGKWGDIDIANTMSGVKSEESRRGRLHVLYQLA